MWRRTIALCLTLAVASLAPRAAQAQSDAELDAARAAFREGVSLTQEDRWAEAVPRFRAVLEVRDTAAVRYNLGLALVNSGEVREGVAYLRGVQNDPSLDEESRADARAEIERVRAEGLTDAPPPDAQPASEDEPEAPVDDGDNAAPTGPRPYQVDLHAGLSFFGFGLVTGARFGVPLVHEGFLPDLEDALYFNVGLDFYFVQNRRNPASGHTYGGALGIPFAVQWQLYLDANWTAFVELGAQIFFHPRLFDNGDGEPLEPGYFVVAAAGIAYRIADILQVTLRVGTPYTTLGLTVEF